MGYYTNHTVTWDDPNLYEIETSYGPMREGHTTDSIKWYDCTNEMTEISKKFPGVLFEVEGHGEESEDIWKAYFKDGKSQYVKAKIVFEEPVPFFS
jgi:hypothetical protein